MTDERIVAYLLGELPDEESARFEEECFARREWPEEVCVAEDDLVDAYLRDELPAERRRLFEKNYWTTAERRRRVTSAAGFLRYVERAGAVAGKTPAPVRPGWAARFVAFRGDGGGWALRAGLAFIVLAIIAGTVWVIRSRTPTQKTFATLTLTISVDNNRAEGARAGRIKIPPEATALKVNLRVPEWAKGAARYRVDLADGEGRESPVVVTSADSESVTTEIPAGRLARGQYALKLFAVRADGAEERVGGSYYFAVE